MKLFLKLLLLVFLLALTAAVIFYNFYKDSFRDEARKILVNELSTSLGRAVEIEDIHYLPFQTFSLENIRIMEPDDAEKSYVEIDNITADVDMASLFMKKELRVLWNLRNLRNEKFSCSAKVRTISKKSDTLRKAFDPSLVISVPIINASVTMDSYEFKDIFGVIKLDTGSITEGKLNCHLKNVEYAGEFKKLESEDLSYDVSMRSENNGFAGTFTESEGCLLFSNLKGLFKSFYFDLNGEISDYLKPEASAIVSGTIWTADLSKAYTFPYKLGELARSHKLSGKLFSDIYVEIKDKALSSYNCKVKLKGENVIYDALSAKKMDTQIRYEKRPSDPGYTLNVNFDGDLVFYDKFRANKMTTQIFLEKNPGDPEYDGNVDFTGEGVVYDKDRADKVAVQVAFKKRPGDSGFAGKGTLSGEAIVYGKNQADKLDVQGEFEKLSEGSVYAGKGTLSGKGIVYDKIRAGILSAQGEFEMRPGDSAYSGKGTLSGEGIIYDKDQAGKFIVKGEFEKRPGDSGSSGKGSFSGERIVYDKIRAAKCDMQGSFEKFAGSSGFGGNGTFSGEGLVYDKLSAGKLTAQGALEQLPGFPLPLGKCSFSGETFVYDKVSADNFTLQTAFERLPAGGTGYSGNVVFDGNGIKYDKLTANKLGTRASFVKSAADIYNGTADITGSGIVHDKAKTENLTAQVFIKNASKDFSRYGCNATVSCDNISYEKFRSVKLSAKTSYEKLPGKFAYNGEAAISGDDLFIDKIHLDTAVTDVTIKGGVLEAPKINAAAYGAPLTAELRINIAQKGKPYATKVLLNDANFNLFMSDLSGKPEKTYGRLTLEASAEGFGEDQNTMAGSGSLTISDADLGPMTILTPLLGNLFTGMQGLMPKANLYNINEAYADFDIGEGKIYTDNLTLNGDKLSIYAKGYVDLKGNLDMAFENELTEPPAEEEKDDWQIALRDSILNLGKFLGRARLKGTLAKPKWEFEYRNFVNGSFNRP